MSLHEWMEQLAATAMLGTERAGDATSPSPSDKLLNPFLTQIAPIPREHALLANAAVAAVCNRAGILPAKSPPGPAPASPDENRPLSVASARHLSLLLAGHYTEVLPEFLDLVISSRRALPLKQLPTLLNLATRDSTLRPRIVATLGSRGRWLAAHHPDWAALLISPSTEDFHTGSPHQRLAALTSLRMINPADARALIIGSWSEEKPEDRAAFVQTLARNLSIDDEPFLESALDDKRKEVREAAAHLLTSLPDSRLARRMFARLTPLVTVTKRSSRNISLKVEVPTSIDAAAIRDGISAKSVNYGLGEKASQLMEIVAATPLEFWSDLTEADPAAFLALIPTLEWKEAVFQGLITATTRQKNVSFVRALISHQFPTTSADKWLDPSSIDALMAVLSADQREALLAPYLVDKRFYDSPRILHLLLACRHPWTGDLSTQFIPYLWHLVESNARNYAANHAISTAFGRFFNPAIFPQIVERPTADPSIRHDNLEKFLSTLQFRHDIHKEF